MTIDTVIVAFTDMQGRLTGKRISARLFVEDVAAHGAECCNYLLAVDVDMNTVDGYAMSSWEAGYGDMVMTPDFSTLRLHAVAAGHRAGDGRPRLARRQPGRPRAAQHPARPARPARRARAWARSPPPSWSSWCSTTPTARRGQADYRDLTPATDYNIDYAMLASTRMEPLLRDIRLGMEGAGLYCEGVKGECNLGQQEIGFRYDDALVTCDNHTIYKNGAKEIADQHGKSLTFMAKYDEREGNSCHIHISFRGDDGSAVFADDDRPARHVARCSAASSRASWPRCAS